MKCLVRMHSVATERNYMYKVNWTISDYNINEIL